MLCESFQTLKHHLFAYSWTLPDQNVASCDVVMSYSMIQKMFYGGDDVTNYSAYRVQVDNNSFLRKKFSQSGARLKIVTNEP